MIRHLERNERVVSWLQPLGGRVEDQQPAVRFKGHFYTLSLRMMKSIWRHIRLKKGFVNLENAQYGDYKLKIPNLLFMEKLRTQSRFNVMRMEAKTIESDRKSLQNASGKINQVVHQVLFPLLAAPMSKYVSIANKDEWGADLLEHMYQNEPESVKNKEQFLSRMTDLYENSVRMHCEIKP